MPNPMPAKPGGRRGGRGGVKGGAGGTEGGAGGAEGAMGGGGRFATQREVPT